MINTKELVEIIARLIEKPFIILIIDEVEETEEEEATVSIVKAKFAIDEEMEQTILENAQNCQ